MHAMTSKTSAVLSLWPPIQPRCLECPCPTPHVESWLHTPLETARHHCPTHLLDRIEIDYSHIYRARHSREFVDCCDVMQMVVLLVMKWVDRSKLLSRWWRKEVNSPIVESDQAKVGVVYPTIYILTFPWAKLGEVKKSAPSCSPNLANRYNA